MDDKYGDLALIMDAQAVREFTELMIMVRKSMDNYLLDSDLRGVACAAGTLTSRINNLNLLVTAYEDRIPNDKDRFELSSLASTLDWLRKDDYAARDFGDITINLPETAFARAYPEVGLVGDQDYRSAITMLYKAITEVVLNEKPMPLSS